MKDELMKTIFDFEELSEKILVDERRLYEELFHEERQIQNRLFDLYIERDSVKNEYLDNCKMLHGFLQQICYGSDEMNSIIDCIKRQILDRSVVDEQFPISHIQHLEFGINHYILEFYNVQDRIELLNAYIQDISAEIDQLEFQLDEILQKRKELKTSIYELNRKREEIDSNLLKGITDFLISLKELIFVPTKNATNSIKRNEYYFDKNINWLIAEHEPLICEICYDGIRILSGSLYGSGFSYGNGITLPEEIYTIPVSELNSKYTDKEIDYIESKHLKRVFLTIYGNNCGCPIIAGGAQSTIESMELTFIGNELHIRGFADTKYLTKVVFDGHVVDYPDWENGSFVGGMFQNCVNLISITGCFEGYRLSSDSFSNCSSLIQLPELRVKQFGDSEFENCKSLKEVHLYDELLYMGCNTFRNCSSLEELAIPDTVQYIGSNSFENCTHLKSIKLPCSITKIAQGVFRNCKELSNVIIPTGVTDIEAEAFYGCRNLSTIYLSDSVKTIGKDVFGDCGNIVIKGKSGSVAEEYAIKNNIHFVVL